MPIAPDIPATEVAIVEMTNTFRKQHKLAAVRPNARLEAAARAYARVLAQGRDLSHTLRGTTPATRAQDAGYGYCQIAENLAMASDSRGFSARDYADRAVRGWQRSPGHRRNLLLPHLTEIGVAVVRAAPNDPRYIAVQLFGRPGSLRYAFTVRNIGKQPVAYEYAGRRYDLGREQYKSHTACLPRDIEVFADTKSKASARYEARDGQVYSLEAGADGVKVRIGTDPRTD